MQKVWSIEDVDWDAWVEHYNVAPTQTVPMVVQHCRRSGRCPPAGKRVQKERSGDCEPCGSPYGQ